MTDTTKTTEHQTKTIEQSNRHGTDYDVECQTCEWRRFGFEFRLSADRAGREHTRREEGQR